MTHAFFKLLKVTTLLVGLSSCAHHGKKSCCGDKKDKAEMACKDGRCDLKKDKNCGDKKCCDIKAKCSDDHCDLPKKEKKQA